MANYVYQSIPTQVIPLDFHIGKDRHAVKIQCLIDASLLH